MIVHVGSILHAYTAGRSELEIQDASTVADALQNLEDGFPGIRFRVVDEQGHIRPHIRIFVGQTIAPTPQARIGAREDMHVLGALSGG